MQTNLIEFMKYITILNKDIALYEDDETGTIFNMNTIQLLARCERMELSKDEYQKAKFEKKIEDLEYNKIEVNRPQSKYAITKNKEDLYTIVDSKVSCRELWNVSNGINVYKSFTNKEEAMEFCKEINDKIRTYFI